MIIKYTLTNLNVLKCLNAYNRQLNLQCTANRCRLIITFEIIIVVNTFLVIFLVILDNMGS